MVQSVLHPQVNDNIYPTHDRKKKCRKELGKCCSFTSELAQQVYDRNTVSTGLMLGALDF